MSKSLFDKLFNSNLSKKYVFEEQKIIIPGSSSGINLYVSLYVPYYSLEDYEKVIQFFKQLKRLSVEQPELYQTMPWAKYSIKLLGVNYLSSSSFLRDYPIMQTLPPYLFLVGKNRINLVDLQQEEYNTQQCQLISKAASDVEQFSYQSNYARTFPIYKYASIQIALDDHPVDVLCEKFGRKIIPFIESIDNETIDIIYNP